MTTVRQLLDSKKNREIFSVSPDQSTYTALQLMAEKDVGAVVVMENGKVLGILTEREYARGIVLCGKTSRHTPVRDTMKRDFPVVTPDANIEDCMRLVTDRRFRYVAVMTGEHLDGLVSVGDLVKAQIAHQQQNIELLERYITGL